MISFTPKSVSCAPPPAVPPVSVITTAPPKVQHQIYQPEGEVKDWTSNPAVRWVYGAVFASIVLFIAVMFWINRDSEGNQSMAQACATMQKSGYAGSVKDCLAKMADPTRADATGK